MRYSVIVPVYNRPDEIDELLDSLTRQTYKDFEVLVVEDGSAPEMRCKDIAESYADRLDLRYFFKENSGQGFSRNFGFERAEGDYFIVFDSDCLIPEDYFESVEASLNANWLDAYGGPDRAATTFTPVQKAISYSMTSLFTTGGIRGSKKAMGRFHPRSFNMGISRKVWEATQGYIITRMGEDIEFSIRIIDKGFKVGLIENAYVYHKRRTDFGQFYKQLHFFGRARINIRRFFPQELKLVHMFPAFFLLGMLFYLLVLPFLSLKLFGLASVFVALYFLMILIDAAAKNKSLKVGVLSVIASVIQLSAYGVGFLTELKTWVLKG
ncbi:glycosyl transferase [Fulvitalea axinellae]|uniref:Glycosyl transferase n=1 Tax=Fulvitalea axinellae TaxID=1182444 RepID=A0AAU9D9K9_9BACT|nr:glycosyl transferase [Fulvitalea axinellae]